MFQHQGSKWYFRHIEMLTSNGAPEGHKSPVGPVLYQPALQEASDILQKDDIRCLS